MSTPLQSFRSPTLGELDLARVVRELAHFVLVKPEAYYTLVIGTDSKNGSGWSSDFVTAVVIHRKGFGGRYFWLRRSLRNITTIRDRIYQETLLSLEVAKRLIPSLQVALGGNGGYNLEIHIDVGEHGETREMIREVVGIVTGNGYIAKTKPESYGASTVADKHT